MNVVVGFPFYFAGILSLCEGEKVVEKLITRIINLRGLYNDFNKLLKLLKIQENC